MTSTPQKLSRIFSTIAFVMVMSSVLLPVVGTPHWVQAQQIPEFNPEFLEVKKTLEGSASQTTGAPCSGSLSLWGFISGTNDTTCAFLSALDWLVDAAFIIPLGLSEYFFTWMLTLNLNFNEANNPVQSAVRVGYPIVLGVANIFFVLILLWIAIATIFDFEPYTARSLLPTLIVTALLINFSLPIGRAFINLSNGIGKMFHDQLIQSTRTESLSGVINLAFNAEQLAEVATSPINNSVCGNGIPAKECGEIIFGKTTGKLSYGSRNQLTVTLSALDCERKLPSYDNIKTSVDRATLDSFCEGLVKTARNQAGFNPSDVRSVYSILANAIAWKVVIYPIGIFVLFAGAIFLLSRVITLAFLLVLAPMAFLMNILPSTKFANKQWWESLTKQAFFFPAFMFFFYLSMEMVRRIPVEAYKVSVGGVPGTNVTTDIGAYFLAAAFLIGSLIVANQMGIRGASTVTGWGKKMSGALGGYVKDRGWKYAGKVAERVSKVPGVGRIAPLRAAATAVMKKGAGVEKKDIEFYTKLSDRQLTPILRGMSSARAEEIWRALPQKRRREARDGLDRLAQDRNWPGAPPIAAPVPAQALQTAVLPVIQGMNGFQNLPQNIQQAITQGVTQAIQNLPPGTTAQAATQTVQQTAQRIATQQAAQAGPFAQNIANNFTATIQSQAQQTALQNAAQTVLPAAAPRPPRPAQQVADLEEEVANLRDEIEELRARRT